MLVGTFFDGLASLGNILAGSCRGVTRTEERQGAQQSEQREY